MLYGFELLDFGDYGGLDGWYLWLKCFAGGFVVCCGVGVL